MKQRRIGGQIPVINLSAESAEMQLYCNRQVLGIL